MWKAILAVLALALFAVPADAQTWTVWRSGPDATRTEMQGVVPGFEAWWYFADGTTDSPMLERGASCPKMTLRRRGGSSPIYVPYACDGDGTNCDVIDGTNRATGAFGTITISDTYIKARNIVDRYVKINPTSGSGYVVAGCGG